jgi:glycosyltransferase 2 family protein
VPGRGGRRRRTIQKHTWKWVAGCVLALAAVVWFAGAQLAARGFDWSLAAGSVARLHWNWLALALVPMFGTYYGRALRWIVFLKPLKEKPSLRNVLSATVIGFTAITLFGRPGEFVRPYLIAVKERVPVTSQVAAWVLERIFDLLMALLVFAFALSRVQASGVQVGAKLAWVLAFGGKIVTLLCVVLLIVILSFRHLAEPAQRWLTKVLRFLPERYFTKVEHGLAAFVQGVEATRSDGALLLVFVYSCIEWLLITACYWCLAQAYAGMLTFSLVDVLIYVGFVSFGSVVQVPGIGGGMQVVAVVVLTELFGVRLELATSFAIVTWLSTFVIIVPIGLIVALKEGLDWHKLRRVGRELST